MYFLVTIDLILAMIWLIAARAVQGVGLAGLIQIVINDIGSL